VSSPLKPPTAARAALLVGSLRGLYFLRARQFWGAEEKIQPGKVVGWIFATEEKGARMK
jgi:hypothetical protein